MRKIRCADCGKSYDYDDDAFCPRCGAFNQPQKGARSSVPRDSRRDGLSEAGHSGSFLHEEFHEEERERRRSGLDKSVDRSGTIHRPDLRKAFSTVSAAQKRGSSMPKFSVKQILQAVAILYFVIVFLQIIFFTV